VARGLVGTPHRPVRLRSSRKFGNHGVPGLYRLQVLAPLRSATGASPLATSASIGLIIGASVHHFALHIFFTLANHRL